MSTTVEITNSDSSKKEDVASFNITISGLSGNENKEGLTDSSSDDGWSSDGWPQYGRRCAIQPERIGQ
jgi:hypothetical protein